MTSFSVGTPYSSGCPSGKQSLQFIAPLWSGLPSWYQHKNISSPSSSCDGVIERHSWLSISYNPHPPIADKRFRLCAIEKFRIQCMERFRGTSHLLATLVAFRP